MKGACPICEVPVITWYDVAGNCAKAKCPNSQCVLAQRGIVGVGERPADAIDNLNELAVKFDHNVALKRV